MPRLPINGIIHYIEHKNSTTLEFFFSSPQQSQWASHSKFVRFDTFFSIHSLLLLMPWSHNPLKIPYVYAIKMNKIIFPFHPKCRTVFWTTYNKLFRCRLSCLLWCVFFCCCCCFAWKSIEKRYNIIELNYITLCWKSLGTIFFSLLAFSIITLE